MLLAEIAGLMFMTEIELEVIKQGEDGAEIFMSHVVQEAVFESW